MHESAIEFGPNRPCPFSKAKHLEIYYSLRILPPIQSYALANVAWIVSESRAISLLVISSSSPMVYWIASSIYFIISANISPCWTMSSSEVAWAFFLEISYSKMQALQQNVLPALSKYFIFLLVWFLQKNIGPAALGATLVILFLPEEIMDFLRSYSNLSSISVFKYYWVSQTGHVMHSSFNPSSLL